ncbi:MAG: YihY/virulence factor BrkB family protein [Algoriphagus sp.]|nr:YihY/virulence factor BrkB family protein [Algoriphagus sp.]
MEIVPSRFKISDLPALLVVTYKRWNSEDPFRMSAIVAYYAVLSLPALLIILINTVGAIWGVDIVTGKLTGQISAALGADTAEYLRQIIINTQYSGKSTISTILGIATLLFGATGVFYHLKISINTIWELKLTDELTWPMLIRDRLISFSFVLVLGFLLLISFVVTTALALLSDLILRSFPNIILLVAYLIDFTISFGAVTVLFAVIFKYLPDANIRWKSVWLGALLTALLFVIGKFLMGIYFGATDPGSTYGAAGSIVLVLIWVSYSCLIFFFGAEFTKVISIRYGYGISPKSNYSRVKQKEVIVDEATTSSNIK